MKDWDPKSLWDELLRTLRGDGGDKGEGSQSGDPSLMFHLLFSAPLVLGILLMTTRR